MTPELQKYYDDRFMMFGSPGWKDLIDDLKRIQLATDTISTIKSVEDLHFRKGELNVLEWLLGLEELSKRSYDSLIEEEETNADLSVPVSE